MAPEKTLEMTRSDLTSILPLDTPQTQIRTEATTTKTIMGAPTTTAVAAPAPTRLRPATASRIFFRESEAKNILHFKLNHTS